MLDLSSNLNNNKSALQKAFHNSVDLKFYHFEISIGIKGMLVYINEIVKKDDIDRNILLPLIYKIRKKPSDDQLSITSIKQLIPLSSLHEAHSMDDIITAILSGNAILFLENNQSALLIHKDKWEKRSVTEPSSESVIKGPKEGFIENLNVNRSLLRRKIKSNHLVFEELVLGKETNTEINIAYIDGIVNIDVLKEVRTRLKAIEIDSILDSGNIEDLIEDSHISPISTIANSQKPDIVASKLLEGRVAVFCVGSPHVLTMPHLFVESLHSIEDYYIRPYIATFLRVMRFIALIVTVTLPALYVALTTYHQDMIPTVLLRTIQAASEGVPLPAVAEAFLMTMFFEFLKESGTRLPRAVGSAISIVGALVLGDAAVKAGIIGAPLILVTAFTAVCSFIVPSLNEFVTIFRFLLILLAGIMGLFGFTIGIYMMTIHIVSLRSFGIPYMTPLAPIQLQGLKDFIIRFPIKHTNNTHFLSTNNNESGDING